MFLPPKIAGHDVTETSSMSEFSQGSCSFCVRMWNSSQQLCRAFFSISAEHFSVFLNTTCRYFRRTPFSIFSENFAVVVLQKTSQYVFKAHFSIFEAHISVVLKNTSQYFFEIISQYFCMRTPAIFKIPFQQFFRTPPSVFAKYLYTLLQNSLKKLQIDAMKYKSIKLFHFTVEKWIYGIGYDKWGWGFQN